MEGRRSSTNYWPGFVDALSNMVLAMIFVVLVLALAMGMYSTLAAEAMAKQFRAEATAAEALAAPPPPPQPAAAAPQVVAAAPQAAAPITSDLPTEKRVRVAAPPKAASAGDVQLTTVRRQLNALVIEFDPQAVALDQRTTQTLNQSLAAADELLRSGTVEILASAPSGFLTEGRQLSFFRAMAVRNYLLERGMAAERITVRVLEEAGTSEVGEIRLAFRAAQNTSAR